MTVPIHQKDSVNRTMQGSLKKWTNYWNGWQPRWFVLCDGMLSYYQSEECVDKECKGAVNVAAAEISAHNSDPSRLDVVVPGEQHFFLKAPSPQKRQEWLVALGSVKSCLNSQSQILIETEPLKRKQGELRLYCDLLLQQVHSIRAAVTEKPMPDVQKLDEGVLLVSESCDVFIRTLESCMALSQSPPVSPQSLVPSVSDRDAPKRVSVKPTKSEKHTKGPAALKEAVKYDEDEPLTFMGQPDSFAWVRLCEDGSINTVTFLQACSTLTTLCDMMGSTAFAPVKMDINGNIRKLSQKHESDPAAYDTLQRMLMSEVARGTHENPHSATDALLWLKRGVWFLREFLHCYQEGTNDLVECANISYAKTLKQYHSWMVRGVFSIAVKAVPTRQDFQKALLLNKYNSELVPECRVNCELTSYISGIDRCLRSLNKFYEEHNLDKGPESTT